MNVTVATTPYGRPALLALAEAVRRAKAGEPLSPVTVVVPTNHAGVTARRALAAGVGGPLTDRGSGTIGVTFVTVHRLAELLGAPSLAASGRRPVSAPVISAALRTALEADPGVFAPVASHPATEEALVSAYRELADLTGGALDGLAGASRQAADLVRIHRAARAALSPRWYDETDLLAAAAAVLGRDPHAHLGELVLWLPQDLPRHATDLLRRLAVDRRTTVVAGRTGRPAADHEVDRVLDRLGVPAEPPAPSAPAEPGAGGAWPVSPHTTQVVTTSDADEEARAAVRAVVDRARDGTPLERVAILYPTRQPYGRLLHQQLAAAGIPVNGATVRPLAESTTGRTLTNLLALRDRGYRRSDVLNVLTGAPVRSPGGGPAPTTAWEQLSREAAVVAGREQWDQRLTSMTGRLDLMAESSARAARRADQARALRDLVLDLIDRLEEAAGQPARWSQRARWLRRLRTRLLGGRPVWETWPEQERVAAQRVDTALDRLAALDEIEATCSLDTFRRTLALELEADMGRVGRFGEGVLVAPLSYAVGLDLDLAVVVGGAEGLLPARPGDDSLLPDRDRRHALGALPLRREHPGRQLRQLHAALAAAPAHVLTTPRGDLQASNDRTMSRWLEEMLEPSARPVPRVDVPSFAHGVTHTAFPATGQEHRLRTGSPAGGDPVVDAGRELLTARSSDRFTRFDGNVGPSTALFPADAVVSSTRLETWAECPHAYFVRYLLGVDPVEDPAEQLWISPLDRGSLVHEVLERFVTEVLARPADRRPGPDDAWTGDDIDALRAIAAEVCDRYERQGTVGRALFWRRDRDRIASRLVRFLQEDSEQRRLRGSRPVAVEMTFGLTEDGLPPAELPLPDGRRLQVRGSVDRVDRTGDGTVRVIDYKTGSPRDYLALSEANPDQRGTRLQLATYGVAARAHLGEGTAPVVAEYWFVNDSGNLRTVGYALDDEVLDQVGTSLAAIVDGIAAGIFPARPTASASDPFVRCRYCDPDGLGVADLRRSWERKRLDPVLLPYLTLAEPDALPEEALA